MCFAPSSKSRYLLFIKIWRTYSRTHHWEDRKTKIPASGGMWTLHILMTRCALYHCATQPLHLSKVDAGEATRVKFSTRLTRTRTSVRLRWCSGLRRTPEQIEAHFRSPHLTKDRPPQVVVAQPGSHRTSQQRVSASHFASHFRLHFRLHFRSHNVSHLRSELVSPQSPSLIVRLLAPHLALYCESIYASHYASPNGSHNASHFISPLVSQSPSLMASRGY